MDISLEFNICFKSTEHFRNYAFNYVIKSKVLSIQIIVSLTKNNKATGPNLFLFAPFR